jgi:hypothetical protein
MTSHRIALDPARIRELFDLRRNKQLSGGFEWDPHPAWHRLAVRCTRGPSAG